LAGTCSSSSSSSSSSRETATTINTSTVFEHLHSIGCGHGITAATKACIGRECAQASDRTHSAALRPSIWRLLPHVTCHMSSATTADISTTSV
jgi:hypothetical protein